MGRYLHQGIKITTREVLLSFSIVAVMVGIGILIGGKISNHVSKRYQRINHATRIDTRGELDYGLRTDIGDIIIEDTLTVSDPVSIPDIPGEFMYIKKNKERYTHHTRTSSDGKGHTRVHHYHSWDVVHTDRYTSEHPKILDMEVDVPMTVNIWSREFTTIKESSTIRYVYYTVPKSLPGVFTGTIEEHALGDNTFYRDKTIESFTDQAKKNLSRSETVFWILWSLLTIALVVLFYYGDYTWLEKD